MKIVNTTRAALYNTGIVSGDGCFVIDRDGKKYIDFESGVWCAALGHNHKGINVAIHRQLSKISHTGYSGTCAVAEEAAEMLLNSLNMADGSCIFLSSGSEAVEFAVQTARRLTGKPRLLRIKNHYLSAYGTASSKSESDWLDIDPSNTADIPFDEIGAFVFEPGNASGTVRLPQREWISHITSEIKKHHGWIIVNEVTTGIGRTGKLFGFEHYGIAPDLVVCGKGLGNGYPVSVVAMTQEVAECLEHSEIKYAQSHQNDPLGCAVVKEVLAEISRYGLIERSREMGEFFKQSLEQLAASHDCIREVRGRGLMLVLEFEKQEDLSVTALHRRLFDAGYIIGVTVAANILRFYPPLIVEKEMIEGLISSLDKILSEGMSA